VEKLYYQKLPTSYEVAQRIEGTVWGPGKNVVELLTKDQIKKLHWNYYIMKEWLEQDIAKYTGWDRVKEDTNDKGQKYELIREDNEEYLCEIRKYFAKEDEKSFEKLETLQKEYVEERRQKEKIEKFIKTSWRNWMENQKEGNQDQRKESQESLKRDQQGIPDYQAMREYVYQRIQPHRDKRLLQIDKWNYKYGILLAEVYLADLLPNHKQQRFVSWYWKRKGRQRWKRRERGTIRSFGRDIELSYLNHEGEENNGTNNGRSHFEMLQTQGSSFLIEGKKENSIVYENFKIYIREASRIFNSNQKKASRNRHLKEAKALPEAEMREVEIIYFLGEILKAVRSSKGSRTQKLLRKILRVFIIITKKLNETYNEGAHLGKPQVQGSLYSVEAENSKVYENFKIKEGEAHRIFSTNQKKASKNRHLKEAKALLEAEMERVENIYFLREILKIVDSSRYLGTQSLIRKYYGIVNEVTEEIIPLKEVKHEADEDGERETTVP
jgi:hypothetical protein